MSDESRHERAMESQRNCIDLSVGLERCRFCACVPEIVCHMSLPCVQQPLHQKKRGCVHVEQLIFNSWVPNITLSPTFPDKPSIDLSRSIVVVRMNALGYPKHFGGTISNGGTRDRRISEEQSLVIQNPMTDEGSKQHIASYVHFISLFFVVQGMKMEFQYQCVKYKVLVTTGALYCGLVQDLDKLSVESL